MGGDPEPAHPPETTPRLLDSVEASLRAGTGLFSVRPEQVQAFIAKSPAAAEKLWRLQEAYDAQLAVFGGLEEDLDKQRLAEWATYGQALRQRIEATAAAVPSLTVPVTVRVDIDTSEHPGPRLRRAIGLHWRLA